ncbi:LLM class flavin-dependent oxidoreductase [Pseudonocardia ailaonensis]|uniref:LLM class flavin-dependent oxidoreductase n=1 Tax=Pseudonocardia ailaonensis TaxID=367279 RepID=A0ABN2MZW0_9PSEU
MKFGIMHLFQQDPTTDPVKQAGAVIRESIAQCVYAEELGFDSVWLAEHHFNPYGLVGSPLIAAGAVAAATERIRIGTAVLVLPFYNPLRLAEDCALVDQISEGRLDVGFGRGYQPAEFRRLGVPQSEARARTEEAVEILKLAWTQDQFDFHGKFWNIDGATILPKPVQDPHPSLYQAASSIDTFTIAGATGSRILTSPNFTPLRTVKKQFGAYVDALVEGGHDPRDFDRPMLQQTYVGDTAADAFDTPRPYVDLMDRMKRTLLPGANGEAIAEGYESWARIAAGIGDSDYSQRFSEGGMLGTAADIRERLTRLRDEVGVTEFICQFNFGGMPADLVRRSMKRFADDVMPHFQ